jgi:hypothetical protein
MGAAGWRAEPMVWWGDRAMWDPNAAGAGHPFHRGLAAIGRAIGWGAVGAFCGLLCGIGGGFALAPPVDPAQPLEHEWYVPHLLIAILPAQLLAGLFLGVFIASRTDTPAGRGRAFVRALIGAIVGLGLAAAGVRLVDGLGRPRAGGELWFSLVAQVAGAVIAVQLGAPPRVTRVGRPDAR